MKTFKKARKNFTHRVSPWLVDMTVVVMWLPLLLLGGVSARATSLVWAGTAAQTNWDINTTANWLNGVTASVYTNGCDVTFDDTATFFSPYIPSAVQPGSITVTTANTYKFSGAGGISGTNDLAKGGTGTLVVNDVNSFSGAVVITNGILQLGVNGALGANPTNYIYATNTGTLDLNDLSPGARVMALSGSGYNGLGALYDSSSSTATHYVLTNIVLLGNTTIGSAGSYDYYPTKGSFTGNGYSLTKVGSGVIFLSPSNSLGLGDIHIVAGTLAFRNVVDMGNAGNTVTVESNAVLELYGNSNLLTKVLVLTNGAELYSGLTAPAPTNHFGGPITLVGTNNIDCNTSGLWLMNTIGGTGGFKKTGPSILYMEGTNSYSGPTIITAGKIVLGANSSLGNSSLIQINAGETLDASAVPSGLTLGTGQILECGNNATNLGTVAAGAGSTISAGISGPGVFYVSALAMTNCTNVVTLGSNPADMTGTVNSLIDDFGSLTLSGTNTFQILPTGLLSTNTPYILAQYSGSLVGELTNLSVVCANPYYTFSFIDPATTAPYLELQVNGSGAPPPTLVWKGGAPSAPNVWDQVASNWLNTATSAYAQFVNGDPVVFDDTGLTNIVNVTAVSSGMTFSNSVLNYTLVGAGPLSGTLDQEGTASVTLAMTNIPTLSSIINDAGTLVLDQQSPSGVVVPATISDNGGGLGSIVQAGSNTVQLTGNNLNYYGTLQVTNGVLRYNSYAALGAVSSILYATNGGTLDLDHVNAGLKTLAIAGSGYNGEGAVNDSTSSNTVSYEVNNMTLVGDASIGSAGRWDWPASAGTFTGNSNSLTKVGTGAIYLSPSTALGLANIHIVAGTLAFRTVVDLGYPANTVTVESNAVFELYGNSALLNKNVVLTNGAEIYSGLTAGQGTNHFIGPITLIGSNTIYCNTSELWLSNTVSGTGGFTKIGTSALYLEGTNTYTGSTIVSAGKIVVGSNSSLGSSSPIEVDTAGSLDVSQPTAFTLGAGQILRGNGTVIGGNITLGSGSTLAPGLPGTTPYALTNVGGTLVLQAGSTNLVKVEKTSGITNDNVTGLSSVTFGGTLVISNIGSALASGDSIPLFSATTYSGSFSSIVPAIPGAGLTWNTTSLITNGTLLVAGGGVNTTSTNITIHLSGNQLTLSWPTDHTGWQLQSQTNAGTLTISADWVNVAGSTTTNIVVIPIIAGSGTGYYRMVYTP